MSFSAKPGIRLEKPSNNPMSKPLATMAGMMGTKISPKVLMARLYQGALDAAAFFTSSLEPPSIPAMETSSSYTLFTAPVPMMI